MGEPVNIKIYILIFYPSLSPRLGWPAYLRDPAIMSVAAGNGLILSKPGVQGLYRGFGRTLAQYRREMTVIMKKRCFVDKLV